MITVCPYCKTDMTYIILQHNFYYYQCNLDHQSPDLLGIEIISVASWMEEKTGPMNSAIFYTIRGFDIRISYWNNSTFIHYPNSSEKLLVKQALDINPQNLTNWLDNKLPIYQTFS